MSFFDDPVSDIGLGKLRPSTVCGRGFLCFSYFSQCGMPDHNFANGFLELLLKQKTADDLEISKSAISLASPKKEIISYEVIHCFKVKTNYLKYSRVYSRVKLTCLCRIN